MYLSFFKDEIEDSLLNVCVLKNRIWGICDGFITFSELDRILKNKVLKYSVNRTLVSEKGDVEFFRYDKRHKVNTKTTGFKCKNR